MGCTATEFIQKEIFDPLGMVTAGWGVNKDDPDLLPMYEYGTVDLIPGKPWSLKQSDPIPAAQLGASRNDPPYMTFISLDLPDRSLMRMTDITNSDAVAELQECICPDAQGTGKADDWWRMFACLMEGGRCPQTGYQLLAPLATGNTAI